MGRTEGRAPTMERPKLTSQANAPAPLRLPAKGEDPMAAPPVELGAPGPPAPADPDAAFAALYRAEFGAIVAVVHSLTVRRDVAEEITQDAFVIAHDRWHRIAGYERPADFVRRVALNRALSSLRRRQAEHHALQRWQGRATTTTAADVRADDESGLWAAVRRLPSRQAQAVALLYVEDQPISGIARILGCTENTVKTHLKRARATLAAAVAEDGGRGGGPDA
jgi:RNA polymerase sigma factor (sigma-70 family)